MRRIFRRSILWLLPVVVVPLGALLVIQVQTLRRLEEKTASAARNWQRSSLEIATAEIERRYRGSATEALTMTPEGLTDVARLGEHFAKQRVPGAKSYFAMRFLGDKYETGYFDRHGNEKVPDDREIEAVKMATVAWHVAHKWSRIVWPALFVDERDYKNRVIMRPVLDPSNHIVGVMGVILDEKLARKAMNAVASDALQWRYPESAAMFNLKVDYAENFKVKRGEPEFITIPLSFIFTHWRAGIRDTCESPEQVAAWEFRNNMMWTGGTFVVLLGAIGLAIGAVARQMRLSQMKSEFVSNVSHELRTPLSSIRVFGEYMRLGRVTQPEKVREYGEYIEAESRRLTSLINNILDFSKIESAEKQYRFCEVDLRELVECTVNAFGVPLRDHGVTISFDAQTREPLPMQIDKDAFGQALVNLLDNAVKYSNGNKTIEVLLSSAPDAVRVSVRDHGIGIAACEQKKIFEKFYRVGSGLVHDVKGSGLGLSIVQHVVAAHGGRIEVTSVPGEGSTFTIVLPSARREPVPNQPTTEFA
jgi:signal transduction histidine kinase